MQREAQLRPWHRTLSAMRLRLVAAHYHVPKDDEAPPFWIEWTDPNHWSNDEEPLSVDGRTQALEAIELFAIDGFPGDSFKRVELYVPTHIRGYELRFTTLDDAAIFCKHLTECDTHEGALSNDYERARAALEAVASHGVDPQPHPIPVRLRLTPEDFWRTDVREVMPDILRLAAAQNALGKSRVDPDSRPAKLRSRVTEFYNDVTALREADVPFLEEALQLHRHGVKVATIPCVKMPSQEASGKTDAWVVRTLNALVGVDCDSDRLGAEHVMVGPRQRFPLAQGIFSAVANSKSLKCVSIDFSFAEGISDAARRGLIHWIAFALFSPHAPSNITRILVTCTALTVEYVRWMDELLRAEEPLTVLFPGDRDGILKHEKLRVSTSRVELMDPVDTAALETHNLMENSVFHNLRVLGRQEHWWVVLLPGWGRAWVKDSDAAVSSIPDTASKLPTTSQSTRPHVRMIHQLDIVTSPFLDEARRAALALMQLVGHGVRNLGLLDSGIPHERWFQRIFDCCPQIEHLLYDTAAPNQLQELFDAFENGRCRQLQHLKLSVRVISVADLDVLTRMLEALASRQHAMAKQLETFTLRVTRLERDEDSRVDPIILTHVLDMLQLNGRLSTFNLVLPLATATAAFMDQLRQDLTMAHNALVPVPLSFRKKTAFISAVWGNKRRQPQLQNPMPHLDTGVLSIIFQFTAA